jgi:hypothetical protein
MGNASAAVRRSSPSANALRLRRARERRRQGLASYRIDVAVDGFLDSLVASHRLTERQVQELRQPQIEREFAAVIADFTGSNAQSPTATNARSPAAITGSDIPSRCNMSRRSPHPSRT